MGPRPLSAPGPITAVGQARAAQAGPVTLRPHPRLLEQGAETRRQAEEWEREGRGAPGAPRGHGMGRLNWAHEDRHCTTGLGRMWLPRVDPELAAGP